MSDMTPRRLSDEQLRDTDLLVEDPLSVEGLTGDSPDDSYAPVIIAEYHLPKGSEVRCSYCEQHQRHQHGFVAEFAPGRRHLIGSTCGVAKLDMQFQAARSSHNDLRSRQSYLRRFDVVMRGFDAVVAECEAILRSDALHQVEVVGKALERNAGDMVIRLRATSGTLAEDVQVRDLAAETREDERQGRRRFKNERRVIGQLRGRGVLKADGLRQRIQSLKVALRAVASLQRSKTDDLKTSAFKKSLKALDDAYEDANAAVGEINRAPGFFAPENVAMLARWAASNSSAAVEADGSTLIVNGTELSLAPIQQLAPISDIRKA